MQQVFFHLPIYTSWTPNGVPIYGFGLMLFFAFLACTWLGGRRAERVGMKREVVQDLAMAVFIGGLIGARIFYMYGEMPSPPKTVADFFYELPRIWEGGIIFYGSVVGGLIGYGILYWFFLRKQGVSTLKLADVIAPSVALGLALGRIGCFLNGCCYGQVACADCPVYTVQFPLSAPARYALVETGAQTAAGFTVDESYHDAGVRVEQVDPNSAAYAAGLRASDIIEEANGKALQSSFDLTKYLGNFQEWPRGQKDLTLKLKDKAAFTFQPRTLGLHPTQLYETVSMLIVILLLLAYEPFKTRDGQVMVLMMLAYAVHRYVNEMLRDDPRPVGFESYASVFLFGAGILMAVWLWMRPAQYKPSWTVATT
jgi:prolipoprotein diacylglyceryltransferase